MIRNYILVIWMVFINFLVDAQTVEWRWDNPQPQGETLKQVYFSSENVGYATTHHTLLKTMDKGETWNLLSYGFKSGHPFFINKIQFINDNIGFAVGNFNNGSGELILKTTNGGATWDTKLSEDYTGEIISLCLLDENIGFVLGEEWGEDSLRICKTIDGGETWDIVNKLAGYGTEFINFIDNMNGFVVGSSIYKTIDGGLNWNEIDIDNNQNIGSITAASFISPDVGFVVTSYGHILKTIEGGDSWNEIEHNLEAKFLSFYDINFIDTNKGIIVGRKQFNLCGSSDVILRTLDGGDNWTEVSINSCEGLNSVSFADNNVGVAVGENGNMLITKDAGLSWTSIKKGVSGYALADICFVNGAGFAVGGKGRIIRKNADETTWTTLNNIDPKTKIDYRDLLKVYFLDENYGFVVDPYGPYLTGTDDPALYKTTDNGDTWEHIRVEYSITDLHFQNKNVGYAVGGYTFIKTIDGGQTWETISTFDGINPYNPNTTIKKHLTDFCFVGTDNVFAVGQQHAIFKSINAGESWDEQNIDHLFTSGNLIYFKNERFNDVFFINSQTGFAVGSAGLLAKTNDGGLNWIIEDSFLDFDDFNTIQFVNKKIGYISGYSNVLKTVNGGEDWFLLENKGVVKPNNIVAIFAVGLDSVYSAGLDMIAYTKNISHQLNFAVSPTIDTVEYTSGTSYFEVESSNDWGIRDEVDWLVATQLNDSVLKIDYEENQSDTTRSGYVTIFVDEAHEIEIKLIQLTNQHELTVSPAKDTVDYTSGSSYFKVESSNDWEISEEIYWFVATQLNDSVLKIDYEENLSDTARSGYITIFVDEAFNTEIELIQLTNPAVQVINSFIDGMIKIYPNPFVDFIQFEIDQQFEVNNDAYVEITNVLGQVVFKSNLKKKIYLESFAKGIYFLTINNQNQVYTAKIIKE